jgi:hypothetical protein
VYYVLAQRGGKQFRRPPKARDQLGPQAAGLNPRFPKAQGSRLWHPTGCLARPS